MAPDASCGFGLDWIGLVSYLNWGSLYPSSRHTVKMYTYCGHTYTLSYKISESVNNHSGQR